MPAEAPRIGLVNKFWGRDRGGVEAVLAAEALALQRCGFRVSVLACRPLGSATRPAPPGVSVRELGAPVVASMPVSARFAAALARLSHHSDGLHFHLPFPLAEAAALCLHKRGPWVATLHAEVVGRPAWMRFCQRQITERCLARMDLILVSSAPSSRCAALGSWRQRVRVVPFGFDLRPFLQAGQQRRQQPEPVVVFLGRLVPYKGVDVLLRAAVNVPARFHILGDGRERSRLQRLAQELGVASRVRFFGHLPEDELPLRLAEGDIFVLPSRSAAETFGVAQVEAMAAGLPVVNTALATGTDWVSAHGETGLTVPPENPAALAGALRHLLEDRPFRLACGMRARQRAHELFDIEARGPEMGALFRELLPGRARAAAVR